MELGNVDHYSHSNSVVWDKDGKVLDRANDMPCFSHLWSGQQGAERLFVGFPQHDDEDEYIRELVNWILNSPVFGKVFKTKDYDEGMKNWFEVDLHQPTNLIFMNLAALRMPWEAGQNPSYHWFYNDFIDMGFSVEEAYFLAVKHDLGEGGVLVYLEEANYNSNHRPFPCTVSFKDYLLGSFKEQEKTMYERGSSVGVTGQWAYTNKMYDGLQYKFKDKDKFVKVCKEYFQSVRDKIANKVEQGEQE